MGEVLGKVVPFILFVLAGECLSLTEHEEQVQDVLEKMYHKITGIDEKLSKIEKRVTDLENSQTTPMENKPTNLENAMRNPHPGSFYRSLDQDLQACQDDEPNNICYDKKHIIPGVCNDEDFQKKCRKTCNKCTPTKVTGKECDSSPTDTEIGEYMGRPSIIRYCPAKKPNQSDKPEKSGNYVEILGQNGTTMEETTSLSLSAAYTKVCEETEEMKQDCSCKALLEPLLKKVNANDPRITKMDFIFAADSEEDEQAIAVCKCYLGRAVEVSEDFKYIQILGCTAYEDPKNIGGKKGYEDTCLDIIRNCDYMFTYWAITNNEK